MEPQWNPAVEQQAIGRVLRINQDQPVTVVSYVMRRSIEEVRYETFKYKTPAIVLSLRYQYGRPTEFSTVGAIETA